MATNRTKKRRPTPAAAPAVKLQRMRCESLMSDSPTDRADAIRGRMTAIAELLSLNSSDDAGNRRQTFNTIGDILLGYLDELQECVAAERSA